MSEAPHKAARALRLAIEQMDWLPTGAAPSLWNRQQSALPVLRDALAELEAAPKPEPIGEIGMHPEFTHSRPVLYLGYDHLPVGTKFYAEPQQAPGHATDEFIGTATINGHAHSGRKMIRVARVSVDGNVCTVPLSTLTDVIEGGGKYTVEVDVMSRADFDKLEEFQGW